MSVGGVDDRAETWSTLFMLRNQAIHQKITRYYKIRGGTDLLPKAFASRLPDKIYYGAPVVRIEQNAQGVKVTFQQVGAYHTLAGDYAICAVPFSVQKNIEVMPPFSVEKQEAIEQLPYLSVSKLFFAIKEAVLDRGGTKRLCDDRPAHRSSLGHDVLATRYTRHLAGVPSDPTLKTRHGNAGKRAPRLRSQTGADDLPWHQGSIRGRRDKVLGRRRVGARRERILQTWAVRLAITARCAARGQNSFCRRTYFSVG
jgi:Flavin containing amine oxidoreductase